MGDNLDGAWVANAHLFSAKLAWNISDVLDNYIAAGSTSPRRCRAKSGNVQVCNLIYGNSGWLRIAGIAVSGEHITAAYVKLNDTYFNTDKYNTWAWRQFVMCQEVGHTFGLGHTDEVFSNLNEGSCMDYTNDPNGTESDPDQPSNTEPNLHDCELLATIYDPHGDVGGGGGAEEPSGCNPRSPKCNGAIAAEVLAGIESNGPAPWGRLVSEHGPQEVYELNLGRGQKIITHVLWTIERGNNHKH